VSVAGKGYPSDLTDEQWALVEPLLPPPRTGPKGGRWEKHPRRRIVDAILYLACTGCQWRYLPKDFPPWPTVYWYFSRWHDDGTVEKIHDTLRTRLLQADGRSPEPSAGVLDSQSVRAADSVPKRTSGYDAGKKTAGRKRFIVTDTLELLLTVGVVAASVQDRDGAKQPLLFTRLDHPSVRTIWADQGFAGRLGDWTGQTLGRTLEIVRWQWEEEHAGQGSRFSLVLSTSVTWSQPGKQPVQPLVARSGIGTACRLRFKPTVQDRCPVP
jgi:transposase